MSTFACLVSQRRYLLCVPTLEYTAAREKAGSTRSLSWTAGDQTGASHKPFLNRWWWFAHECKGRAPGTCEP